MALSPHEIPITTSGSPGCTSSRTHQLLRSSRPACGASSTASCGTSSAPSPPANRYPNRRPAMSAASQVFRSRASKWASRPEVPHPPSTTRPRGWRSAAATASVPRDAACSTSAAYRLGNPPHPTNSCASQAASRRTKPSLDTASSSCVRGFVSSVTRRVKGEAFFIAWRSRRECKVIWRNVSPVCVFSVPSKMMQLSSGCAAEEQGRANEDATVALPHGLHAADG